MDNEAHRLAYQLFLAAFGKPDAEAERIIEEATEADPAVQREVRELLAAARRAGSFLESKALDMMAERTPTRIGAYRIVQLIGKGGFGVVYLAEQEEPVRRTVALKVLSVETRSLARDPADILARFERERQTLALLEHPNVARVLDAGTTEEGVPYFVMEHVDGSPITEYCDRNRLGIDERLRLFVRVCAGVQHAHQQAIVHRDLKPGNILVHEVDGVPTPKIIDFGIAKALNRQFGEGGLATEIGVFLGTPEYMSPEQAERSPVEVDTRSDIYSLGVLLYELLTGCRPIDRERLRAAAMAEVRRTVREWEPARPSDRLSTEARSTDERTTAEIATNAERRRATPSSLSRRLSGDLDWITMRALEKDRERRYASIGEFAADVDRHLRDEAVLAGPPSAAYRFSKFAKRNRGRLVAMLSTLIALVCGLSVAAYTYGGYRREFSYNSRLINNVIPALDAMAQEEVATGDRARMLRGARIYEVSFEFLNDVAGPSEWATRDAAWNLGVVLLKADEPVRAAAALREAWPILRRYEGEQAGRTRGTLLDLCKALHASGELSEAEKHYRELIRLLEAQPSGQSGVMPECLNTLASIRSAQGDAAEAAVLRERAAAVRKQEQH